MPHQVEGLSHLLIQVSDLQAAEHFYCQILGLGIKKRDSFGNDRPLIITHQGLGITLLPSLSENRATGNKNLEHVAFWVTGLDHLIEICGKENISVDGPLHTGYGRSIYIIDPDGNRIECIERS